MSLIQLMRFAKSLRSGRDVEKAFQPAQDNLVPDFTRSGPRPDPVLEEPGRTGRARSGPGLESAVGQPQGGTQDPRQAQVQERGGVGGRWSSRGGVPRPSLKADAKGQLSLEFVRVVRNDLSDADLELVPAKRAASPVVPRAQKAAVETEAQATENLEPECSRWSRFRARLFKVGATD